MINTYNDLIVYIKNALARQESVITDQIPNFIYLAELKLARMPKNLGYKKVVSQLLDQGVAVYAKPNRWRSTVSMNYGTGSDMATASRQSIVGVRTLSFDTPHPYDVGTQLTIRNVGGSGYNGTFTITAVTTLSITYTNGIVDETVIADTTGFTTTSQNSVNTIYPRSYEMTRDYWPDDTQTDLPEYYADYDYNHWLIAPTPSQNYPFEVIYYEQPMPLSASNQQNWFTEYAPDALYYGALIEASAYLKNDDRVQTWQSMYNQAITAIDGEAQSRISDASTMRDRGK